MAVHSSSQHLAVNSSASVSPLISNPDVVLLAEEKEEKTKSELLRERPSFLRAKWLEPGPLSFEPHPPRPDTKAQRILGVRGTCVHAWVLICSYILWVSLLFSALLFQWPGSRSGLHPGAQRCPSPWRPERCFWGALPASPTPVPGSRGW